MDSGVGELVRRCHEVARFLAQEKDVRAWAWALKNYPLDEALDRASEHDEVERLVLERRNKVFPDADLSSALPAGRLLAFDPDGSMSDGAAMTASKGFVDKQNTPGTSAWVALTDYSTRGSWTPWSRFLLVWVPPRFEAHAEAAIDANPEKCLQWAAKLSNVPLLQRLRVAGVAR